MAERQNKALFDSPMAHRADPLTSFVAGERFERSGRLRGQMLLVLLALRKWPGKTSAELAQLAGLDHHAVARWLPNLASPGLAERGPERECQVCQAPCITWRCL
jgi:DNA-binding MarR family transcriptional regulator